MSVVLSTVGDGDHRPRQRVAKDQAQSSSFGGSGVSDPDLPRVSSNASAHEPSSKAVVNVSFIHWPILGFFLVYPTPIFPSSYTSSHTSIPPSSLSRKTHLF